MDYVRVKAIRNGFFFLCSITVVSVVVHSVSSVQQRQCLYLSWVSMNMFVCAMGVI
jgi:hypothetical protein